MEDFRLLGLALSATEDEVKQAYRLKALKCHPDVNAGKEAAAEFNRLTEAYKAVREKVRRTLNLEGIIRVEVTFDDDDFKMVSDNLWAHLQSEPTVSHRPHPPVPEEVLPEDESEFEKVRKSLDTRRFKR